MRAFGFAALGAVALLSIQSAEARRQKKKFGHLKMPQLPDDWKKWVDEMWDWLEEEFHGEYIAHHHRCPRGGKVLMLCTSHAKHPSDATPTGGWLEMVAQPYYEFTHSGLEVEIASVKGGKIPMDPLSLDRAHATRATKKFMNDTKLMRLLEHTLPISQYDAHDYSGIFIVGGHGAAYDMPKSAQVENVLMGFLEEEKPIAAVAHGPAALVNLKLPGTEKSIFDKRRFAAFTNEEEDALGLTETMRYDSTIRSTLVDKIIALGGVWLGMDPFDPYSIADRGIITGQNPASSEMTAESLVDEICGEDHDEL